MATAITDRRYTPDDLLKLPDGDRFELVDGQLVEKEMSAKGSRTSARLCAALVPFVESRALGTVLDSTASYQCFSHDPDLVRRPDVSFIGLSRWKEEFESGHVPIPPDLAVEVVSPNDYFGEVLGKVKEFLSVGVRLVWVINPEKQIVQVHRPDHNVSDLPADGELAGEDVLPGFRCSITDLFRPPPMGA